MATYQDRYVLGSASLTSPRSFPVSEVLELLQYTDERSLAAAHVSLIESYDLLHVKHFGPELRADIPSTCTQALSPTFVAEWKPAMEKEI